MRKIKYLFEEPKILTVPYLFVKIQKDKKSRRQSEITRHDEVNNFFKMIGMSTHQKGNSTYGIIDHKIYGHFDVEFIYYENEKRRSVTKYLKLKKNGRAINIRTLRHLYTEAI